MVVYRLGGRFGCWFAVWIVCFVGFVVFLVWAVFVAGLVALIDVALVVFGMGDLVVVWLVVNSAGLGWGVAICAFMLVCCDG